MLLRTLPYQLTLLALISMGLAGCSDSTDRPTPIQDDADFAYEDDYADDDYVEEAEAPWDPASEGYRKARMKISLLIDQAATLRDVDNSTPGDPKSTNIDWHFTLTANRELDVWVMPDLRFRFPASADFETQMDWLRNEPYFEVESADDGVSSDDYSDDYADDDAPVINAEGSIDFAAHFVYQRPNASDVVRTEKHSRATGRPLRLEISNMRPSYYGHGYQTTMKLDEVYSGESHTTLTYTNGRTETLTDQLSPDEPRMINFEPPLNPTQIMPYPFEAEDQFPDLAARNRALYNEALAGMRQADFAALLLGGTIAGMTMTDGEDSLTLHYRSDGQKAVPMFYAGIELLAAPMTKNLIDFKIEFELQD